MDFSVSFQAAVLGFFFLQGLLYSGLLVAKGKELGHPPSYWLALFVLLCSLYLVPFILGYSGWYGRDGYREFLFFVPFQQLLFIGPVIYFYTRRLLNPGFRINRKAALHFLPGVIYLLYALVVFLTDAVFLDEYYFYADGRDKDLAPWYQVAGLLSMIIYSLLSLSVYGEYRKRIYDELSYADNVVYSWVKQYLVALLAILLLRSLFLVLLPNFGSFGSWFWYYLVFACLFSFIAVAGYTNVLKEAAARRGLETRKPPEQAEVAAIPVEDDEANDDVNELKASILTLMEKGKAYENPTLTLTDVAGHLGVNSRQVSRAINRGFELNFNDFVNGFRVDAVKDRFRKGEHERYTLLSIGLDCGFNSKRTFNRVFKRSTGLTPQQYLAKNEQDSGAKS